MNTSITLYIDIKESRQRHRVQILKGIQSVMKNILKMKKWISPISNKLIVCLHNSDIENTILIKLKTSDYPYSLTFFIPKKAIDDLNLEASSSVDPIFILESVYKLARIEYNKIGAKYNKSDLPLVMVPMHKLVNLSSSTGILMRDHYLRYRRSKI